MDQAESSPSPGQPGRGQPERPGRPAPKPPPDASPQTGARHDAESGAEAGPQVPETVPAAVPSAELEAAALRLEHPVIAGYDGSASSRNALAYAAGVSRRLGRPLLVVYVCSSGVYCEPLTGQVVGALRLDAEPS